MPTCGRFCLFFDPPLPDLFPLLPRTLPFGCRPISVSMCELVAALASHTTGSRSAHIAAAVGASSSESSVDRNFVKDSNARAGSIPETTEPSPRFLGFGDSFCCREKAFSNFKQKAWMARAGFAILLVLSVHVGGLWGSPVAFNGDLSAESVETEQDIRLDPGQSSLGAAQALSTRDLDIGGPVQTSAISSPSIGVQTLSVKKIFALNSTIQLHGLLRVTGSIVTASGSSTAKKESTSAVESSFLSLQPEIWPHFPQRWTLVRHDLDTRVCEATNSSGLCVLRGSVQLSRAVNVKKALPGGVRLLAQVRVHHPSGAHAALYAKVNGRVIWLDRRPAHNFGPFRWASALVDAETTLSGEVLDYEIGAITPRIAAVSNASFRGWRGDRPKAAFSLHDMQVHETGDPRAALFNM